MLDGSDKIRVSGVALYLRLLLGLLFRATLGGRLGGVFLRSPLRLLVLLEDGFDRLLTRGELGGDVLAVPNSADGIRRMFIADSADGNRRIGSMNSALNVCRIWIWWWYRVSLPIYTRTMN